MSKPIVLIAEELSPATVEALGPDFEIRECDGANRDELLPAIADVDAILVRSATKVDAEAIAAAKNLKVIARAGVGLDNVDVKAATQAGVMVVNAPTSNIVSAAELAVGLLLASARNIAPANAALKDGQWKRSKYSGVELSDKTLGVVGLGRIGQLVATRLLAFGMKVVAYDPFVQPARAAQLGIRMVTLDELLAESDFITVHLPKTADTLGLIGEEALRKVKPTVRIINAEAVRPGIALAENIGRVAGALAISPVEAILVEVLGEVAENDVKILELSAVKGVFSALVADAVTYVNAPVLAAERGVTVSLTQSTESANWRNTIRVHLSMTDGSTVVVGGTSTGPRHRQRLVEIDGFEIDVPVSQHIAFLRYDDRPGIVGIAGRVLGEHGINIGGMQVSRDEDGSQALIALTVDSAIPGDVLGHIREEIGADSARSVDLEI